MTHLEIVEKLIGPIRPIGETNTDNERFENLQQMCALVDDLVTKIHSVAEDNQHSHEFSVKRAAEYADNFLSVQLNLK